MHRGVLDSSLHAQCGIGLNSTRKIFVNKSVISNNITLLSLAYLFPHAL